MPKHTTAGTAIATEKGGSKHRAVYVSVETLEKMKPYQQLFGTPIGHIVAEALDMWYQSIAVPCMETLQERRRATRSSNVVVMGPANANTGMPEEKVVVVAAACRRTDS